MQTLHLYAAWIGIFMGFLAGAGMGLFFHRDDWLGGYSSWPRRMARLGHISFFGIGFLNLLFGLTLTAVSLPPTHSRIASAGFLVAVVAMQRIAAWPTVDPIATGTAVDRVIPRAASDHQDFLCCFCLLQPLLSQLSIYGTFCLRTGKCHIETMAAAYTISNGVIIPIQSFIRPVRISNNGPAQGHHIQPAV